jgi:hypothetical protein
MKGAWKTRHTHLSLVLNFHTGLRICYFMKTTHCKIDVIPKSVDIGSPEYA